MEKEIEKCFEEQNGTAPISKIELPLEESHLKIKILNVGTISSCLSSDIETTSNLSRVETIPCNVSSIKAIPSDIETRFSDLSCIKTILPSLSNIGTTLSDSSSKETISSKPSIAEVVKKFFSQDILDSNSITVKSGLIVPTSTSKSSSRKLEVDSSESTIRVEELLESINIQTEETNEMIDMISRAKEKMEFFIFHVNNLLKSLEETSTHLVSNSDRGNTYVKKIYRKKLEEFALNLLGKIKNTIQELEVNFKALKEQKKSTMEVCKKITDFRKISHDAERSQETSLKEAVDQIVEEMCWLKSKQLSDIEKTSYIETDIEMLYDLYRRLP